MIDLLTAKTAWEPRQIAKRAEGEVRKHFSVSDELILNRKLQGVAQGLYTLSDAEQAKAALFQQAAFQAQAVARQAEEDNAKLALVLAHEQAEKELVRLDLLLNGRAEVPAVEEVLEERDPETGEVLVEYVAPVAAVPAIEPLAQTVDSVDEQGNPVSIPNPVRVQAVAEQDAAQAVITGASAETLELVEQRR
jgi:hypothetical protein